jgi:hypothetical protein
MHADWQIWGNTANTQLESPLQRSGGADAHEVDGCESGQLLVVGFQFGGGWLPMVSTSWEGRLRRSYF